MLQVTVMKNRHGLPRNARGSHFSSSPPLLYVPQTKKQEEDWHFLRTAIALLGLKNLVEKIKYGKVR